MAVKYLHPVFTIESW